MKRFLLLHFLLVSFFTNAQFSENFNNQNGSDPWALPSGQWTRITSGPGTDWEISPAGSSQFPANTPQHAALIQPQNIGAGNSSSDYLVTPLFISGNFLRFFSRTLVAGNQGTTYQIRLAPASADPTQISSFTTLVASFSESQISATFSAYQEKWVTLPVEPGVGVYVAFVRTFTQSGSAGSDGWLIDDIANFPIGPGCGGFFVDSGGTNTNYPNNANETTTICPEAPGDLVTVTFTQFQTETSTDGLYVYDGNSISAPQISSTNGAGFVPGGVPGSYWGSALPGPFTSSSPDGCLTFRFRSDSTSSMSGWLANVTCGPPDECPAPVITSVETTSVTATFDWSSEGSPDSWEVLVLPCGSEPPSHSVTGTVTDAHPYTATWLSPNTCYSLYVRSDCGEFGGKSQWSNAGEAVTIGDQLLLTAFLDANGNGVKDSGEALFPLGKFTYEWNDSGEIFDLYSPDGSAYLLGGSDTNFFDIAFEIFDEYAAFYQVNPASYENVMIAVGGGQQFRDFAVTLVNPYQDAAVTITPVGQPRPGMTYENVVTIHNFGVAPATGTVTFTADAGITNIAGSGITPTANGFTYDFSNLAPMQTIFVWVTLTVADVPVVNLGDLITNTASVTASGTDLNLDNNLATSSAVAVNSYDPNDITESRGPEIDIDEFNDDDYLYYTVRFQNTGTANALTVSINVDLDAQLDWDSATMVASSHNYDVHRTGNELLWFFYNINLVPQAQSEALSQGWIVYKVKAVPGFEVDDVIPATAAIYFDSNPAVITETFTTTFVDALATPEYGSENVVIFPNPAHDAVYVTLPGSARNIESIRIYNIVGQKVADKENIHADSSGISVSSLSKGIYVMEIQTDSHQKITRKIIVD